MRIPRYGRDLAYNRTTAELLIPAVGVNTSGMGEVFRLNLEHGRFMQELQIDVGGDDKTSTGAGALQGGINPGSVNVATMAEESHGLMAFGTSIGTIEYWDPRSRTAAATLITPNDFESSSQVNRAEITALSFHRSGITNAVGTSTGLIYLYDLRSPAPYLKKDHGYGYPVQDVQFLTPSTASRNTTTDAKIMSCDKRILKIWDESDGSPWASVEPSVDINCVAWCKDSGMFMTANEGKQQHAFLVPQLGPAPKWCSFLDNVVEEMADDPNDPNKFSSSTRQAGEIYDNYKFLTLPQLRNINLDHLMGKTNLLRPYMHGFFVAQRLYEEARLIANPSSWEEERAKRIREKIEKERESRIRGKKKIAVKVNRKMAQRILEREEKNERRRAKKLIADTADEAANGQGESEPRGEKGILADSRFSRLFQDEDYAIDETSREFQALNPSTQVTDQKAPHERGLTAVEQEEIDELSGSSSESESDEPTAGEFKQSSNRISTADYRRKPGKDKKRGLQLEVSSSTNIHQPRDRSFQSRAANVKAKERPRRSGGVVGEKMVTFEPSSGKHKVPKATPGSTVRAANGRRSASGNTFRRM